MTYQLILVTIILAHLCILVLDQNKFAMCATQSWFLHQCSSATKKVTIGHKWIQFGANPDPVIYEDPSGISLAQLIRSYKEIQGISRAQDPVI